MGSKYQMTKSTKSPLSRDNPMELIADCHHGQYAAQVFAECVDRNLFPEVDSDIWAILESGPDHEDYAEESAEIGFDSKWEGVDGLSVHWIGGAIWIVDGDYITDSGEVSCWGETLAEGAPSELKNRVMRAAWNLYHGPNQGDFSRENLDAILDLVESHCDDFMSKAPRYMWTDYGIEEINIDAQALMEDAWPDLASVARYL